MREPASAAAMAVLARRVVLAAVIGGAAACDFDNEIDPYTEYYNLQGDWNAFTADDCKAGCCNEPTCTVWQFAQYPMGHQAQCMWGDSSSFGDSGGIQFTGEQGRGGPDDPGGDSSGGHHHHHTCVGVHCNDLDMTMWVILFGVAAGLYTTGGLYYGMSVQGKRGFDAVPNALFWRELGGLLKDGAVFALSGGTAKAQPRAAYAPVPQVSQVIPAAPYAVVVDPQAIQPAEVVAADVSARPPRLSALVLCLDRTRAGVCCLQPSPGKKKRVKKDKTQVKKVRVKKTRSASATPVSGSSLE